MGGSISGSVISNISTGACDTGSGNGGGGSEGSAALVGEIILEEKRIEGTINELLSMAGKPGVEVPRVMTFITRDFLIVNE
jgi:hypothetical protein